jgi:hypothetical protein
MSRIQTPNFSGDISMKHKAKFANNCIVIICVNRIDVFVDNQKYIVYILCRTERCSCLKIIIIWNKCFFKDVICLMVVNI